jgi:hypothetical protein
VCRQAELPLDTHLKLCSCTSLHCVPWMHTLALPLTVPACRVLTCYCVSLTYGLPGLQCAPWHLLWYKLQQLPWHVLAPQGYASECSCHWRTSCSSSAVQDSHQVDSVLMSSLLLDLLFCRLPGMLLSEQDGAALGRLGSAAALLGNLAVVRERGPLRQHAK